MHTCVCMSAFVYVCTFPSSFFVVFVVVCFVLIHQVDARSYPPGL